MRFRHLVTMALVLLILVVVSRLSAVETAWTATPTGGIEYSSPSLGYGTSDPISVTIASTSVTNLCASLPSNDYDMITYSLTAGTGYLNGSVSTPTIGIPLVIGNLHTVPLPRNPKDRCKINVIPAATGTVKVIAFKSRP